MTPAGDSLLTGVRQIVQIKYFPHGYPDFFVAAEVRYKTYQYRTGEGHTGWLSALK